ncbi:MAG: hypothetical protein F4Z57_16490 [Gemmatimonadetes bacterium]|nr:hypothetical protein [Gemmatimonadota bacterium]MYC69198.1 hypothetical protein [Gemmatimonadota bacterium]
MNVLSRNVLRRRCATAWTALVLSVACSQQDAPPVALVGDVPITSAELRQFASNVLPGLRPVQQGQAARQDYLQTLIDRQLMLRHAREMGIDREPSVWVEQLLQRRTYLANLYRKRDLHPQAQVTDADIARFFAEHNLGRERLMTAILVQTKAEAQAIQRQLAVGASFAELSAQHTLDPRAAAQRGRIGFVNRSMASRLGVPEVVFDHQPTDVVSEPLPLGRRFHLVRFTEDRQVEVDSQRDLLARELAKAKRREVEKKQVELLAYELGWHLTAQGLAALPSRANAPLFAYANGQVSTEEYLEVLKKHRVTRPEALQDSATIAAFARRAILPELVLADASEKAGYHQEPEAAAHLTKADEELLLKAVYQRQVSASVTVDTAAVERYIAAHTERFTIPESICFDELIAPSPQEAQQLKDTLTGQEDLAALAKARGFPLRPRRADGLVCMHRYNSIPYPQLWRALQQAEVGVLNGPVRTREGFALFVVIRTEPARPEPPQQARQRARATLVQQAEQARFDQWIASLREKYRDEIDISAEQLAAALPDSLLASLGPRE